MQLPMSGVPAAREPEIDRSPTEGRVVYDLGRAMQTVGSALVLFGALGVVGGIVSFTSYAQATTGAAPNGIGLVMAIVTLIFGMLTGRSGRSFERVATTHGEDVTHLMAALGDLKKMFGFVANIIRLAVCFVVAFLLVGGAAIAWSLLHR